MQTQKDLRIRSSHDRYHAFLPVFYRGCREGSHIIAGPKGLMPGEEIFVPYTHGSSYILTADDIDDRREHWYYVAKGRKITTSAPTPRISSTPTPPRGAYDGCHLVYGTV